jgi:putative hydrolase of the HAD superfamily
MNDSLFVRAVFFDAVGTLFAVRGSVGRIYWEAARDHGVRATPEAIDAAFAEVFPAAPPLAFPSGPPGSVRRLEKQWWREVVHRVFQKVGPLERFDEYFDSVFEAFSRPAAWEAYPETLPVLSALKERGLKLGVISNFDSRIYPLLSELGIFKFLDSVHISSREGTAKPAPGIFLNAVASHGLQPPEAVHVGDGLSEDFRGARGAGLQAVWLDREGRPAEGETPRIGSLEELLPDEGAVNRDFEHIPPTPVYNSFQI